VKQSAILDFNVFLRLHEVKRKRYIFAFLVLGQNWAFFKGLRIRDVSHWRVNGKDKEIVRESGRKLEADREQRKIKGRHAHQKINISGETPNLLT